jgi:hypothetical protein
MTDAVGLHSPVVAQYQAIKADYPQMLVVDRMGDFHELFHADAEKAARLLDITLTQRGQPASRSSCLTCCRSRQRARPRQRNKVSQQSSCYTSYSDRRLFYGGSGARSAARGFRLR